MAGDRDPAGGRGPDGRSLPAGTVTIDFVYQPDGIRLSRTVTLAALPVFLLYAGYFAWDEKKRRKH